MDEIKDLFDLSHTAAAELIESSGNVWEVFPKIKDFIIQYQKTLSVDDYYSPAEGVYIAKSAKVAPTAYIGAPCVIGENTEIRHCAYIRGSALIGNDAVIGNSTELKNCIVFDGAQLPHYNYVGDSIIGYRSHLGAGAVTSNVKSDKSNVTVYENGVKTETGLRKFGAIIADQVEVGCGCVLNPGTIIGRNTNVYPLSSVRGCIPADSIYKRTDDIVRKEERDNK